MRVSTRLALLLTAVAVMGHGRHGAAAPVTASGGGLTLSLPRLSYHRGETMPILLTSKGEGTLEVVLRPEETGDDPTTFHLVAQVVAGREHTVNFDTSEVRAGRYELRATQRDNLGEYVTAADLDVAVSAPRTRGITLGVLDVPDELLKKDGLHALAEQGFDVVYFRFADPTNPEGLRDRLDDVADSGLQAVPILDARSAIRWDDDLAGPRSQAGLAAADWAQLLRPADTFLYDRANFPVLCPRNPAAMALMEQYVKALAQGAAGHPGAAAVALDREAAVAFDWKGQGAGCYCEHCLAAFKQQSGKDAPAPEYVPPGRVAPAGDAVAAWLRFMGKPGGVTGGTMKQYNTRLKQVVRGLDPNLPVVQLPGGQAGELDGATYVVSYDRYHTVETKLAYTMDLARARQREAATPVTVVFSGLSPVEKLPNYTEHLRALGLLAISRGAGGLVFGPHSATTRPEVAAALADLRDVAARLGPMLATITSDRKPVAVLHSETTEGYQRFLRWQQARDRWQQASKWFEEPWEHEHSFYLGYSALLRSGIPVEIVTERDVLAGELGNYQSLVLIDHEYSTEPVEAKIKQFQEGGKLVFADLSSVVRPERAILLPTDFSVWSQMIPLGLRNPDPEVADIIRERQVGLIREATHYVGKTIPSHLGPSSVAVTPPEVLCTTGSNGETRYVVLVNPALTTTQEAEVTIQGDEEFVYDLSQSKPLLGAAARGRIQFSTTLPPASLKAFLLSPREITHLRMRAEQEGRLLTFAISVGGEAGLRVSGSYPLKVTLTDPNGNELPVSGHYATDRGRLSLQWRLAKTDVAGLWTITVAELASGLVRTQQIEVK